MATEISLNDQFLWVSNQRLASLLSFALVVGSETAGLDAERGWVEKLRHFEEQAWPGIGFDLNEQFPDIEEKKFWTRVFIDVARRIFLRQLGNQEVTFWQSSAIGDAYVTARMLMRAVQESEIAWHPDTEDSREAGAFDDGKLNIRV